MHAYSYTYTKENIIKTIFLTVPNYLGSNKGQLAHPQQHLLSELVLYMVYGASSCQKPQRAKAVWQVNWVHGERPPGEKTKQKQAY